MESAPSAADVAAAAGSVAVHCGTPAPVDAAWWALLSIDIGRRSDHTMIETSSDMALILERAAATRRHWSARARHEPESGASPRWHLALMIGSFQNRASADTFCRVWAQSCRGAISRVARGEMLSNTLGLKAYGDFRAICRDPHAYDYITIVDAAPAARRAARA